MQNCYGEADLERKEKTGSVATLCGWGPNRGRNSRGGACS